MLSERLQLRLLAALYTLFTFRAVYIAAVLGVVVVGVLFVFSLIIDALFELGTHIAMVWTASTPIEKLLIFAIAWLMFYKLSPVVARLISRKGHLAWMAEK